MFFDCNRYISSKFGVIDDSTDSVQEVDLLSDQFEEFILLNFIYYILSYTCPRLNFKFKMAYKSTFLKENYSLKSEIHRLQDAMKELNKQLPTGNHAETTRTVLGEANISTPTNNSELKRL